MRNILILLTMLLLSQNLMSQKIWVEGYDILDTKRIVYKGDSVTAFYQPKGLVFVNRNNYPEYFTGLPDSLPPLPDGKYLLYSFDMKSNDTTLFHEWFMKDGKRDSVWIIYYTNGNPEKILEYRNGEPEGRQIHMNESGIVIADWNVCDGFNEGHVFFLDEEMNSVQGEFHKGTRVGIWIYRNPEDSLSGNYRTENYHSGRFSLIVREYKNNELVSETFHRNNRVKKYIHGKKVWSGRRDKINEKNTFKKEKQKD